MIDMSLPELYAPILDCARAQTMAADLDDWTGFAHLAMQRAQLLESAEQAIRGDDIEQRDAVALVELVLATDRGTVQILQTKLARLQVETARFRQTLTAAAAYTAPRPDRSGSLLDGLH